MNIILLGAPGAGKGTQAARIVDAYALCHVSTGDILRRAVQDKTELGLEAKAFMDAGDLVPDKVVIGLVRERLAEDDCANGFILDGYPRNVRQAKALEDALGDLGMRIDAVISVDVARAALLKRLTARRTCRQCGHVYNLISDRPTRFDVCDECEGEVYQRDDDSEATVSNRLDVYDRETAPLIGYYREKGLLRSVDGTRDVEGVFSEMRPILKALV